MSLSSALSAALTGLSVNTAQLQLTANNISNAQNPGYTAKTASIGSIDLGTQAAGAQITGFTRATDAGLTLSYNTATSAAGLLNQQNSYLTQVQAILGSSSNNPPLSDAIAQFQSAWAQYSAAPESVAQQQNVIQTATNLTSQVQTISTAVLALGRSVTSDISNNVSTLNSDLTKIATLNQQIGAAGSNTEGTLDLQDQRDQLVNNLAAITNVTVTQRSNNQIALYTPSGIALLDQTPQTFSYNGTDVVTSSGQVVTNNLTGGSLQAQLNFIYNGSPATASTNPGSEVIRKLNEQLSTLVGAFTSPSAASSGDGATITSNSSNFTDGAAVIGGTALLTNATAGGALGAAGVNATTTFSGADTTHPVETVISGQFSVTGGTAATFNSTTNTLTAGATGATGGTVSVGSGQTVQIDSYNGTTHTTTTYTNTNASAVTFTLGSVNDTVSPQGTLNYSGPLTNGAGNVIVSNASVAAGVVTTAGAVINSSTPASNTNVNETNILAAGLTAGATVSSVASTGTAAVLKVTGQFTAISGAGSTYAGGTITNSGTATVISLAPGQSIQVDFNPGTTGGPGTETVKNYTNSTGATVNITLGRATDTVGTNSGTQTYAAPNDTTSYPSAFATAYNATNPAANSGSLASNFFTVSLDSNSNPIPATFQLNAQLLNGTATIRQTNAAAIAASFTAGSSYTAAGLSVTNGTYSDLGVAILSGFQQAASSINTQSTSATQQQTFYQQSLSNETGVNVDSELVKLTTLQNSYAASAHVISTVNQMLADLTNILG